MFKLDLVVSRARGNQDISSRNRDAGGTGASREIKGGIPNCIVDVKFRQQSFEILEYFLITIAASTVP